MLTVWMMQFMVWIPWIWLKVCKKRCICQIWRWGNVSMNSYHYIFLFANWLSNDDFFAQRIICWKSWTMAVRKMNIINWYLISAIQELDRMRKCNLFFPLIGWLGVGALTRSPCIPQTLNFANKKLCLWDNSVHSTPGNNKLSAMTILKRFLVIVLFFLAFSILPTLILVLIFPFSFSRLHFHVTSK